ncbi:hypothetical protein [Chamaesiphon sp. VAR_48_metabat_135_sub]|uniref:hypothetical protein n=1 Tax=Chamaesiphon sp. VAR_48_metabat_135_sub TaxID=2964699 RepID=UPI00286BC97A|nr:hypothetical protein [Chamaesiphon sp. VAR_48_metabat_135_sub]
MASERQLQDRGNSTQEDSLGIQDAQQVSDRTNISESPTDSELQDDGENLQQVDLLTKQLQDNLNSLA